MKVLGPKETGTGILIEYDAGHVSPDDNKKIISEFNNNHTVNLSHLIHLHKSVIFVHLAKSQPFIHLYR